MKTQDENIKKVWIKPVIQKLNIKKDTFGGSGSSPEGGSTNPVKKPGPPIR